MYRLTWTALETIHSRLVIFGQDRTWQVETLAGNTDAFVGLMEDTFTSMASHESSYQKPIPANRVKFTSMNDPLSKVDSLYGRCINRRVYTLATWLSYPESLRWWYRREELWLRDTTDLVERTKGPSFQAHFKRCRNDE
jgi:hypothetical protein